MSAADVYPTPARLRLLADIDGGLIEIDPYGQARNGKTSTVTARWAEVSKAGWATRPDRAETRWVEAQLTDAGRAELNRSDGYRRVQGWAGRIYGASSNKGVRWALECAEIFDADPGIVEIVQLPTCPTSVLKATQQTRDETIRRIYRGATS